MGIKVKSVSIIGCGWLGFPLAKYLLTEDWQVKGSTTSENKLENLRDNGIESFLFKLPFRINPELLHANNLVLNIPPGRGNSAQMENYSKSIGDILLQLKTSKSFNKLIFISSTSVYGSDQDIFDEGSFCNSKTRSGEVMLEAESLIMNAGIPYVILRFGGLAGPERHPGRFLAGRTGLTTGNQSVNFLHLDDAIRVINHMLETPILNEIFNVVSPIHSNKEDFYIKMAESLTMTPPTFDKPANPFRREISARKLLDETEYKFIYPDPMLFKF